MNRRLLATAMQEHGRLIELRERYVGIYLAHLAGLSKILSQAIASDIGLSMPTGARLNDELTAHLAAFSLKANEIMRDIKLVLGSEPTKEAIAFAESLARESTHGVVSQMRIDVTRIARYRVEAALNMPLSRTATRRQKQEHLAWFMSKNIYSMDSIGRHLRSERYVRGIMNVTLFRARNETYTAAHSQDQLIMYRPKHDLVSFKAAQYGQIVGSLHPFAEPIILIDNTPNKAL